MQVKRHLKTKENWKTGKQTSCKECIVVLFASLFNVCDTML